MTKKYPKRPCPQGIVDMLLEDRDMEGVEELATEAPPFKDRDGIEGVLRLSGSGSYRSLYFVPTAKGRRHPKYLELKREMHDDWDTDVGHSDPERWAWYIEHALRCRLP